MIMHTNMSPHGANYCKYRRYYNIWIVVTVISCNTCYAFAHTV